MKIFSHVPKIFLGVALFCALTAPTAFAVDFPKPVGYVNDFAGVLSAAQRVTLEATLTNFEKQTSNQVVVAIVPSLQGLNGFSYSQAMFTAWGIGQKSRNNGVLFVMGPKEGQPFPEHGDAFINVGRGLEGALPDSVAGSILRNEVFPYFAQKQVYEGIVNGISNIMKATQGEYAAIPESNRRNKGGSDWIMGLIWFGFMILSYLASFLGRSKSWWLGGVIGGAGGLIAGFVFWTGIAILVSAGVFGVLGLIFDFVVSRNYEERRKKGLPTDFWHSRGGFWFGGGRGFGGGGGFSGFGGGGSGGGGAGGGW